MFRRCRPLVCATAIGVSFGRQHPTGRTACVGCTASANSTTLVALQALLYSYGFSVAPIVLISAEQVAAIAPLIDATLGATKTTGGERDTLLAFKDRMIHQNR
jgi:hypothetical protein